MYCARSLAVAGFALLFTSTVCAQPPMEPTNSKPLPSHHNVVYGSHERNVLDLWPAKSDDPTPVLIFFHGGGFIGGDKWNLDPDLLQRCLDMGISVASANYRFSTHAPFPASMLDGARAIQFIRSKAVEWKLDPKRIAAAGSSAGAGITLWVGLKEDLADSKSTDPILRESTRLSALVIFGGQCSYDPRFIRENIGGRAWEHPALPKLFGITPDELDSPKAYALYEQTSMINFVTPDDPPVFGYYVESPDPLPQGPNTGPTLNYSQFGQPIEGAQKPGEGIHHPNFGYLLKEKMDGAGVGCIIRHRTDFDAAKENPAHRANEQIVAFLLKHFTMVAE